MKYLKQLLVILCVSFAGELLYHFLPLPVPASIYGIVLMLAGLMSRIIPLESVKETGMFLIEIMPVMFISPAAGVIDIADQVRGRWLIYLVMIVVSTAVVMGVSGSVTQALERLSARSRKSSSQKQSEGGEPDAE